MSIFLAQFNIENPADEYNYYSKIKDEYETGLLYFGSQLFTVLDLRLQELNSTVYAGVLAFNSWFKKGSVE